MQPTWRCGRTSPYGGQTLIISPPTSADAAQLLRSLRACGLNRMAGLMDPIGAFITWEDMQGRGASASSEPAFNRLLLNLKQIPELAQPEEKMSFFLEGRNGPGAPRVWQYSLPARRISVNWLPCGTRETPERDFLHEVLGCNRESLTRITYQRDCLVVQLK